MAGELSRRDAILAASAVIAGPPVRPAAPVTGGAGSVPDLAGKVVVVQTRNRPLSNPAVIGECRFESQGGRVFLVGIRQPCSRHMPSWTDGIRCCVAWDSIEEYMIFESLSDYHLRLDPPEADDSADSVGTSGSAEPSAALAPGQSSVSMAQRVAGPHDS